MKIFQRMATFLALAGLVAASAAGTARAADTAEVGMVTQLTGTATFGAGSSKDKPLASFMKVAVGEKLKLDANTKLQLVYFENGRQETWNGPATLTVGKTESQGGKATPAAVKTLPPIVLKQLTRAPGVVADLKARTGMIMVRGLPMLEMRKLDENYQALRKDAAEDDVTPELYLLAGLHELKLYRDMKPVLEDMRRRQPNNPEVLAVYDHYSKLMNPPAENQNATGQ